MNGSSQRSCPFVSFVPQAAAGDGEFIYLRAIIQYRECQIHLFISKCIEFYYGAQSIFRNTECGTFLLHFNYLQTHVYTCTTVSKWIFGVSGVGRGDNRNATICTVTIQDDAFVGCESLGKY